MLSPTTSRQDPREPIALPLPSSRFYALALLYFASGAAGLVDEVVFCKYLSLVFGATAQASSAVLVAFMGGLATGAFVAARLTRRVARPLRAYGGLEIAVGALCALSPSAFAVLPRVYVALAAAVTSPALLQALRGALAAGVVFLPAVAMGATLPLVTRLLGPSPSTPGMLARLYALNTAGGAVGSLVSAYAMIPAFGLAGTLRASAGVSVAVGILGAWLDPGAQPIADAEETRAAPVTPLEGVRDLLVASVASGLLVFASEVVFVHLLALIVGTSVYAFGLVLTIFLVCLSAGAALSRRLRGEGRLVWSLAFTAFALGATIPVWDRLPAVFEELGPSVRSWAGREVVRGGVAFAALAVPVTAMGMTFPLVLQAVARGPRSDAWVGKLTGANTLGAIVGSLAGGFLLLPLLGSQRSLAAIAVGYGLTALVVAASSVRTKGLARGPQLAALGAVALPLVLPRWDANRLTSGANVYFDREFSPGTVVFLHEDVHGGFTTVKRNGAVDVLYTNGKFQGDNGFQMAAQHGFAHIPGLFVRRFDRALIIGLGTGTTLGTLAAYPFARIDVSELSPGIVQAARTYFSGINRGALEDPRVHVTFEDGRNVLLVSPARYDLIGIELSSVWFAGAANLYNREFYETAASRLTDAGVLQQWIQLHHTSRRIIASQIASVRSVFPHVALFIRGDQGILVASKAPLVADLARLADLERLPSMRAVLAEEGAHGGLAAYLDDVALLDDAVDRFLRDSAQGEGTDVQALVSTDDNVYLEYETPKNNLPDRPTIEQMADVLWRYRTPDAIDRHVAHGAKAE